MAMRSYPKAIRETVILPVTTAHKHKNGAEECPVCSQHDLEAHKKARDGKRTTDCPKCQKIIAAIEGSALPVVPQEKLDQATEISKRILGER